VSVLENMHAHETFKLVGQNGLNIFSNMDLSEQKLVRKILINAILATDMTRHNILSVTLREKRSADEAFYIEDSNARKLLTDTIIHAADISAQTYDWKVAQKWEERINQEFVMQVAKEKAMGLTPSPFMVELDQPMKRYKSQIFFCDVILKPFWFALAQLFPHLEPCVKQLERNRNKYEEQLNKLVPKVERIEESNEGVKVIVNNTVRKKNNRKYAWSRVS